MPRITDDAVRAAFQAFPARARKPLMQVRDLIFRAANRDPQIGAIEETLKWGEPAYLTTSSRSGSTIRLGYKAQSPDEYAIFFNCQTSLVDTFRSIHPELDYQGNRAIVLKIGDDLPVAALMHCLEHALTYHRTKRSRPGTASG
ncbi:MAG: DUF1801 domain-containing protein [Pseudomonadales bacterium]|nr:DUF1801 domain-containing protein [Pseudomonadales bacterium]